MRVFGRDTSARINTCVMDIYEASVGKPYVRMSEERGRALENLRSFMFERVYEHANTLIQESAERMLRALFGYFSERPGELPALYARTAESDLPRAVCDYLSSMTDRYAINVFKKLFVPREGSV